MIQKGNGNKMIHFILLSFYAYIQLLVERTSAFCNIPAPVTYRNSRFQLKPFVESSFFGVPNKDENLDIDDANSGLSQHPHLIFPGGGIFFYWQAGVVSYLREHDYDLSRCTFSGASAGALTATLAATNVDYYRATELALQLAADGGVWDRSEGLQGIWGPMIHRWLDTLLPTNTDPYVKDGRLTLLVTPVPEFSKDHISQFQGRNDLINCNLASVHLVCCR